MLRYAITDRHIFPGDEAERSDALLARARQLAHRGIDAVQLREKDLPERALEALAIGLAKAVRDNGAAAPKILLNGPAHIAVAAAIDGVHLRGGAGAAELDSVRQAFHLAGLPHPIVSVSCHSLDEVHAAALAEFDLILFGPIFEKRVRGTLVTPGLGLDCLRQACKLTPRLLALGGVTEANVSACLTAGAAGIAGIRTFFDAT